MWVGGGVGEGGGLAAVISMNKNLIWTFNIDGSKAT